jgi:hypothetical protein
VLTTMRLCERMHLSPRELAEVDLQTITDWLTIMEYETELNKPKDKP